MRGRDIYGGRHSNLNVYLHTHIILHEKYDSLPDRRNAIKAPHTESKPKQPIFMNIHNTL